jgi:hypothetical protein
MKKSFKIDSGIYSEEKIQQAISDFKEVANISFINSTISIESNTKEDIEEIFNELMNYIISL